MQKRSLLAIIVICALIFPVSAYAKLAPGDFIDIQRHWGQQNINTVYNLGLMKGTGITPQGYKLFTPDGKVTRAELAAVLVRTFKLDYGHIRFIKEPAVTDYFTDVQPSAWYAGDAMMCAINQIFNNLEERRFAGDTIVTRIEIADAIKRSFDAKGISVPMIMMMPVYKDMDRMTTEYTNAMVFVSDTGIMQGENQLFRPYDSITRAELATVLVRCHELINLNPPEAAGKLSGYEINQVVDINRSDNMEIDLNIPQVAGLNDHQVQYDINYQFNVDADKFRKEVGSGLADYIQGAKDGNYPLRSFAAVSRYKVGTQSPELLSMYVDYYQYTGGAHGLTTRKPYNWNIKTGQPLDLKDLFKSDYDYRTVINQYIRDQISRQPEQYFTGDMGFTSIKDDQDFYLEPGNLVIYFQQYDIAPYAVGIPEFRIPLSDFTDNLKI